MYIRKVHNAYELLAPAKLNLFFEVLAKRADGFHEIETLMAPIACYDTLTVAEDRTGSLSLICQTAQKAPSLTDVLGTVPSDRQNIAYRAVELLRARAGLSSGLRMCLTKRIPAMAGLGGGSSDAAAALIGANLVWQLGWSRAQLAELAAELGSDVPFFLYRGFAICRGRGERIEPLQLNCPMAVVVARPPVGLSTPEVYKNCRVGEPAISLNPLVAGLRSGKVVQIARHLHNRLQTAAAEMSSWIAKMQIAFNGLNCLGHQMSGSGSSYFGICANLKHARHAAARLRSAGLGWAIAAQCG